MAVRQGQMTVRVSSDLYKWTKTLDKTLGQELAEGMAKLGKIGEEEMRRKIESSGTNYSRTRYSYGYGKSGRGRIDSGKMLDSVFSRLRPGPKSFELELGYIKGPKKPYYAMQDQGFKNVWKMVGTNFKLPYGTAPVANVPGMSPRGFLMEKWAGRRTEGTHALREGRQEMIDRKKSVMNQVQRRIAKRMNK